MTARSYQHRGGEPPLLGSTIPEWCSRIAAEFADRPAVVSLPQGLQLSYRALASRVDAVARGLLGLGYGPGDRIGIWAPNHLEWILTQFATARIGAILVTINPAYQEAELVHAIERGELDGLVTLPAYDATRYAEMLVAVEPTLQRPTTIAAERRFPSLRRVVVYDPTNPTATTKPAPGFLTWPELLAAGRDTAPERLAAIAEALDPDDPINIQFTSGTTGAPKAVVLTHHNILNNAWFTAQAMNLTPADRLCIPVPFYHCFGMVLGTLLSWTTGSCVVIPSARFDPGETLRAVERERCTALHGVPTMFIDLLEHPDFSGRDLASLRTGIIAGAPCPRALVERIIGDMGCRELLIGYGQTEASPVTHLTSTNDSVAQRVETVGTNLPHQEVKIVDPATGHLVSRGTPGELCFRGYHVMKEYFRDPLATEETIDADGWLHSGDLGSMDRHGYVTITGRLKDMIIRGGENVYPREIEDVLYEHPDVVEAAVFGVPDPRLGEEIMAWIQLRAGATTTPDALRHYCRDRLAHFKTPRYIRFVDTFPMTVTGKLQKYRMREEAVQDGLEAYAPPTPAGVA